MTFIKSLLSDELAIDTIYDEQDPSYLQESVMQNLNWILNSRKGSLIHMPSFGMPDISELYQGLPYTLRIMSEAIINVIQAFEPRIKKLKMLGNALLQSDCIVEFQFQAQLTDDQYVGFQTHFLSGGQAIVS